MKVFLWLLLPIGVALVVWGLCVVVGRWCDPDREPFGPRAKPHDEEFKRRTDDDDLPRDTWHET